MPINQEFEGTITLSTGYEVRFEKDNMTHTMNHLSLAIVGELSNKHLFGTENPSSAAFQQALFDEISHIMNTQVPDDQTASQLMANMLYWHLTDRFFADMTASLYMPEAVRVRFLRRDWSLITNPPGAEGQAE